MSHRSKRKPALGQRSTSQKHLTPSSKLKPMIWSRDIPQRILCFHRCQLSIAWMSSINKDAIKHYGRHLVRLLRRRRRAYAPTSNNASQDNHEKINSWVSFACLYEGCPILRQIYAWHCIVLYPPNNRLTIQYNCRIECNTMPWKNLSEYCPIWVSSPELRYY